MIGAELTQPSTMPHAGLGVSDMAISRVGFGAWAAGGGDWKGGWGPQDDRDSIAAIHRAVDLGVNWIDTAPAYGFGRAEKVVGRAVRQLPDDHRPYVFTKCGLVWREGVAELSNVLTPESIRAECDASLRRLGVERLDLLQVHWPSHDGTPVEASWATLARLVDAGKVRWIGVSNFGVELLERCEAVRHVDTVQPELNLLDRRAAATVIPWAAAHGTGVLVYSPMRSGLLTGQFTPERARTLAHDDWRRYHDDFKSPRLERNLDLVDRLAPVARGIGCTLPELVVAWTLAWPGVTGAIVGARRPEQVDGWVRGATVQLTDADLDAIADAILASGAGVGPVHPRRAVDR